MPLFRAARSTLIVTSLILAGTVPAASGAAQEEPVTVVALTAADGALTGLADEGLSPLRQDARSVRAQSAPDTDGVAVLTAPIATDDFYVAGVTWDGADALPQDAAVFLRVMEGGQWQDWTQLEVESSADEPAATGGTEPYVAAGAEAVQVQITGDAERLPANVRLSLTPEWPGDGEVVLEEDAPEAELEPLTDPLAPAPAAALPFQQQSTRTVAVPSARATTTQAATAQATAAAVPVQRPAITSRAGWGANERQMTWRPTNEPLRGSVIHHTAGSNTYTRDQAPGIVRGIYYYHAVTRGWGDIGYNFLVDKWGRIYEGRSGSLAAPAGRMPVGAHAAPYNTGTVGLSVMGDYTKVGVPSAAMNAMVDVLAWQFGRAGLDAGARFVPASTSPAVARPLTRIFGHRDVSSTACPGDDIYSRLGWMAQQVDRKIDAAAPAPAPTPGPTTPAKPATPAPSPVADPLTHTGRVFLNNDWTPWSSIDFPFGDKKSEIYVGDWDGDGVDTLAIRRGNTFYVHGRNASGALESIFKYGRPGDEVLVGDWDGNGTDTFAVRRGKTFHVKNTVSSGDADRVFVYGRTSDEVLVGDWDTDGEDTFAVRRRTVFHVKNSVSGGPADTAITYGRAGDRVLVGDWDGDGVDTFAVRRGIAYHVKNRIAGGSADLVLNYGRRHDTVLVGDWNGDRTDTLGVHRP